MNMVHAARIGKPMYKYSIVIPVYNAEKYINECVSSVLAQSYKNFEILLVDDGSTDDSFNICKKYANNDKRITVMQVSNGGPARIRNIGIKEGTGDYIWFIDSDDKILSSDALKGIDDALSKDKADILFFLSEEFDERTGEPRKKQDNYVFDGFVNCDGEKMLIDLYRNGGLKSAATSPVNKIISRRLLQEKGLYFVEQFRWHAEDEFLNKVVFNSQGFIFLNNVYYWVRIHPNSITTTINEEIIYKKILTRLVLVEMCCKYFSACNGSDELKRDMLSYYSYYYLFGITAYFEVSDNKKKKSLINEFKNKDFVFGCMKHAESRNLRIIAMIYHLLGLHIALQCIKWRYTYA